MPRLSFVLAVVWLGLALPVAAKDKDKVKQKAFIPVAASDLRQYVGRYVGVEDEFWIDVTLGSGGALAVELHEHGERVTLLDPKITGARLRGDKVDAGGIERRFDATFGHRVVNGDSAFGLLVEGAVRIHDDVVLNRLFYRQSSPAATSK